jgi:hypothetical protein
VGVGLKDDEREQKLHKRRGACNVNCPGVRGGMEAVVVSFVSRNLSRRQLQVGGVRENLTEMFGQKKL